MKPITSYTNYRELLADFVASQRAVDTKFSFRKLAQLAGVNSPNYIQRVIKGERALGHAVTAKICDALELEGVDRQYFRTLVEFAEAPNGSEKAGKAQQLGALRHAATTVERPQRRNNDHCEQWYLMAVFELASCRDFSMTAANVSRAFRGRVSAAAAEAAIGELVARRLLLPTAVAHRYTQANVVPSTTDEKRAIQIRREQEFFARLAADRLSEPLETREFQGITIAVSEKRLRQAKRRIKAFADELLADLAGDDDARQVFRVNLQIFPITFPVEPV